MAAAVAAGCHPLQDGGFRGWPRPFDSAAAEQEEYRERFQGQRDPDAMRWLLAHAVRQGMTVAEVSRIFGQEGERVVGDRKLKRSGSPYRRTDVAYRWGPDADGRSVYLFFRDGKLTGFDPREFAE